jgi:hypothetical protein
MSGANLRKFILFDRNDRELELTPQSNMPVELVDSNGFELEMFADGSVPVRSVPQSTPAIILPFVHPLGTTTLAAIAVIDAYDVAVTSAAGMVVGQHFRIIDDTADRFYFGEIVNIVGTTITLDTQIDFAYGSGAEVTFSNKNLAVDGSGTPVTFQARTGNLSITSTVNVTRLLLTGITDTAASLPLFGDLPKLTRGVAIRLVTPTSKRNILNIKNNEEIVNLAFDFTIFESVNPAQGVDGFSSRLTFGGESKIGTVLQIAQNDNLEVIVQDDLSGLVRFIVTLEGNIVQE